MATEQTAESTLIFLHVPKTGGMSLLSVLERNVAAEARFLVYRPIFGRLEALRHLSDQRKRQLKLIAGHVAFGIHELLPQPCDYLVLLSDPVRQVISDYYHVRRSMGHYLHKPAQQWSLEDFARHRFEVQGLTNRFTRQISGYYGLGEGTPDYDLAMYAPLPPEALEIAKHNLETRIRVIGLLERFDESLLLAKREFGWKHVFYTRRNVASNYHRTDDLPAKILQRIEQYNLLDMALYQFAQQLFAQRIQHVVSLSQLRGFRRLNWLYGRLYNSPFRNIYGLLPRSFQKTLKCLYGRNC